MYFKQKTEWEDGFRGNFMGVIFVCFSVRAETVICLDTHRFDVMTKQDIPQVAGALVSFYIQLPLWTHRRVSFGSAAGGNWGNWGQS
jgi:hypothetical protein